MNKWIAFFCLGLFSLAAYGKQEEEKVLATREDSLLFKDYYEQMRDFQGSYTDLLVETALSFLETPYRAATLEINDPEKLVVNLREVDCTTYLESMLALAASRQMGGGWDSFVGLLEMIRYRNGELDGYVSRLHYFSEWLQDNQKKGIVYDVTRENGGEPWVMSFDFMSKHADAYKMLNLHPEWVDEIIKVEEQISQDTLYYIPKEKLAEHIDSLQSGDMIAITTAMEGLDVAHVGFLYRDEDRVYLLHASSKDRKVVLSDELLTEYLSLNKNHTGIMLFRAKELMRHSEESVFSKE